MDLLTIGLVGWSVNALYLAIVAITFGISMTASSCCSSGNRFVDAGG